MDRPSRPPPAPIVRLPRLAPSAPIAPVLLLVAVASSLPAAPDEIPASRTRAIEAAAPEAARVRPPASRRVLIWNTPPHLMGKDPHRGYCIPYGIHAFRTLGDKTGAYEPVVADDLALMLPDRIRTFDAIVLNNASGPWITPTDRDLQGPAFRTFAGDRSAAETALRRGLLDWVERGGGILAIHYAIGANRHWPEFARLLGATFTGHPWNEEVAVAVDDPTHPLVAAFGGKDFRLADEIFQYGPPYDRSRLRVLLSLDTSRTNMGVRWIRREDNDFALAWLRTQGKGRIVYTSFGHRTELYWNRPLLRFYLDAIQFTTGDLEAPTSPGPLRRPMLAPGPTPAAARDAEMARRGVVAASEAQVAKIRSAAPRRPPAKPGARRRVLVWGRLWTHGPNPVAAKAFEVLGETSGAYSTVVSDDPRMLLGDRLPRFDALVMNNIHERDPFLPLRFPELDETQKAALRKLDAAVKQSILEFVRGGKGLVGVHAATAALQGWPEYGEMVGGYYASHVHEQLAIRVEDRSHPVTACFGEGPFRLHDEVYIFREPFSRETSRVLLSLDLDAMRDPGKRLDRDYAISWVRRHGDGRVFYTTLGHEVGTYQNPLFLEHLLAGVQFAIGDLDADARPATLTPGVRRSSPPRS